MLNVSPAEVIDFPGCPTVVVRRDALPMHQIAPFMDAAFSALGAAIGEGAFVPTGPAFSVYRSEITDVADIAAGFPILSALEAPVTVGGETLEPSTLPACRLATARYTGPYDGLGAAWGSFLAEVRGAGHEVGLPFWEAYETEPTPDMDPNTLVTGLAIPVGRVDTP